MEKGIIIMINKNYVFRIIITALLVIALTVSVISCKEDVADEQAIEEIKEVTGEDKEEIIDSSENKEEIPPAKDEAPIESALEITLKEKASFISEALAGVEFNTKTGELTAKAGNEWGIKEGESIGWYIVNAFKMETADGIEEKQDAIGLIPSVIEAMQDKSFEEKGEKNLPIPINLKETEDVKIKELKIKSGWGFGASSFGLNVSAGTIIYSPLSIEWGFNGNDLLYKNGTNDKSIHTAYESDLKNSAQIYMDFVEGNIIPSYEETGKFPLLHLEGNKELLIYIFNSIKLGDPFVKITGLSFLDETANNIEDSGYFYESPGQYQLDIFHFKNIVDKGTVKTIEFLNLKGNQEPKGIKVFVLPNESAHEQIN